MRKYFLFVLVIALFGCTSTHLTSSWKKESYEYKKYEKVLVLGITERKSARAAGERALVNELRNNGILAEASIDAFPAYEDKKPSKEEMEDDMKKKGFDAVFTITLLDIEEEQRYVPGQTYVEPAYYYRKAPVYYNNAYVYRDRPFYGYYSTMYRTVYEPGYMVNTTRIFLETNLFDLNNGNLVWTAQSESVDPEGTKALAKDYAKAIMNGLREDGVFN